MYDCDDEWDVILRRGRRERGRGKRMGFGEIEGTKTEVADENRDD